MVVMGDVANFWTALVLFIWLFLLFEIGSYSGAMSDLKLIV